MSRAGAARERAHRREGRVATGLRSRAGSPRQFLHGLAGILSWFGFAALWVFHFLYDLPESWPLISLALAAFFVLAVVMNAVWVAWNRRIYWRHDRRRRTPTVQETRFDRDVLERKLLAPARSLLMDQPRVLVGLGVDDEKVYTPDAQTPVPDEAPADPAPAPAEAAPAQAAPEPVVAAAAPVAVAAGAPAAVMIDRAPPSLPVVSGGGPHWHGAGRVEVSASGSIDEGSGLLGYEWRASFDGGALWSAPVQGATVAVEREGQTMIQFRALDRAGNACEWVPAAGDPAGMVRIDRTAPSAPVVEGAGGAWSAGRARLVARGAADALSGVAGYEYRFSLDGGASWSAPQAGSEVIVEAEGLTIVQFRSLDWAGNSSPWAPEVLL